MTLTLWVPDFLNPYEGEADEGGAAVLREQLDAFTRAYPDVQVQVVVKKAEGPGGLYHLLSTAYEAAPQVLPDLILLNRSDLRSGIQGEIIQPLHDVALEETDLFAFATGVQDAEGKRYGIPYFTLIDHVAYREGVARVPPLSWSSVLTSGYSMLFPAAPDNELADDALLVAYLGTGGKVVDEEGQAALERNHLEEVYRFFDELLERNLLRKDRALGMTNAADCWEAYTQGLARLSPVPTGSYWPEPPPGSAPGWMPTSTGAPLAIAHTWSLALIAQDPARQDAALRLAQWLTSSEQMAELTQSTGLMPTRFQALRLWGLLPEQTDFLELLLGNAIPTLPASVDRPVRRALQAGLVALLRGEVTTPEEAASHALTYLRQ